MALLASASAMEAQARLFVLEGEAKDAQVMFTTPNLGDVDADGYDDYGLVHGVDFRVRSKGIGAQVISGRDGRVLYEWQSTAGWEVAGLAAFGDRNRDGHADLALCVARVTSNKQVVSELHVLSGRDLKPILGPRVFSAPFVGLYSGTDFDRDGYRDVMLTDRGSVGWILLISGKDLHTIHALSPAKYRTYGFGLSVAVLDDLDGDSYPEIIGGDPWFGKSTYIGPGAAFVMSGKTGRVMRAHLPTSRDADGIGVSVTILGDLDRDGVRDYAVGASAYRKSGVPYGACMVYSGKTGTLLKMLYGPSPRTWFGQGTCDPGDWNGDGVPDLAISQVGDASRGYSTGAVEIYSGKDWKKLSRFTGKAKDYYFGNYLASLGDVDGDKRNEILIGSQYFNYNASAKNYVEVWTGAKKSLYSDTHRVSLSALGAQRLSLDAGLANAGNAYLVLGTLSGVRPGLRVGKYTLPLQPDPYFFFSASAANSGLLPGSLGILDAKGQGSCRFQALPGLPRLLAGLRADHAFLVFGKQGFTLASNWVPLLFEK